ncbi:MAG: hypothetical protein BJ554DRAFT_3855 [Olpidium bornovanus]|uniref:Uncharacterized protein n=1 Tax=Olpidium bornovanus TaxID=278681 RepID=A0A8H8DFI3_9FUNG|nr:MAG: hypothetical protein BJ554DRAFT_3855 [Olpidium bornovanus]
MSVSSHGAHAWPSFSSPSSSICLARLLSTFRIGQPVRRLVVPESALDRRQRVYCRGLLPDRKSVRGELVHARRDVLEMPRLEADHHVVIEDLEVHDECRPEESAGRIREGYEYRAILMSGRSGCDTDQQRHHPEGHLNVEVARDSQLASDARESLEQARKYAEISHSAREEADSVEMILRQGGRREADR